MGGVLLGTLAFATGERRRIRATELELVDAFASQLACRLASLRRERRLERACAALGTANRRKDEFLAVLAHELRNPLAPIRTAVETLKLTSSEPKVRRASDIIDRQVTHLAGLVDDLFEAACIHRGKLGLTRTHVDLNDVVRDAVEACRPLLAAAAHELVVALPQEPCVLAGDFRRLTQVVSNLLRNAVKFTPPRGRIEVVLAREGGSLVLRVRDNGRGMDAATRAHVFEMFYQGTRDGDRSGAGLGIGLALVKSFVTLHGGSVEAVSEGRGCGSELIVTLPCVGAALPAAPPIAGPRNEPRRKGARRVDGAGRPEERRYDAN
jgi:signal transduction histidine kinase